MGLKVNFSQDEAESTAREVVPTGEYACKIVEIQDREVKPGSLNVGKPYWNIRFVVQDGPYAGSSLYGNIMLFEGKDGTLSTLSQFLKAMGFDVQAGEFELPEIEELVSRDVNVRGTKYPAGNVKGKELPERFQIKGYKSAGVVAKAGSSSLLP